MQSFRNGIREAIIAAPREKLGGSEKKQSASSLIIQYPIPISLQTKAPCFGSQAGSKVWAPDLSVGPEIMLIK